MIWRRRVSRALGSLSEEYKSCQAVMNQSPINIETTLKAHLSPLNVTIDDVLWPHHSAPRVWPGLSWSSPWRFQKRSWKNSPTRCTMTITARTAAQWPCSCRISGRRVPGSCPEMGALSHYVTIICWLNQQIILPDLPESKKKWEVTQKYRCR